MLTPRITEKSLELPREFNLPDVIADHKLIRCIGEGSYGRVYLAQNELTKVYRAVKVVFRDAFRDSRPYLREFEAICRFEPVSRSHAGFVQVLQVGKLDDAFYYIMELADDAAGAPIQDSSTYSPKTLGLNRGETLPIERCVEIGSRLADCLSVLHEHQLIHRDIKPSNIIFVNGKPKLADIGLVTQIEEAKSFVGTAGFMPPEGPTTPAADIYSLGKVLYEIATGKDRCEFPQLPSDITAENALDLELNQIVLKACHPDPNERYRTAKELRHELDLLQAGRSIKQLRHLERRLRVVKFTFAISVVLGVAAFLVYYQVKARREQAERERQRQAGYLLAEGTSEMRKGLLTKALPFFVRAADYDPSDTRSHSLRIGSARAHVPQHRPPWKSPREASFSPDGKWLIGAEDKGLSIFECESGQRIKRIQLQRDVSFAKFSPDGARIGAAGGAMLILLTTDGEQITQQQFESDVADFSFSPRDNRIAVALKDGSALFFDPNTSQSQPFPDNVPTLALSFDHNGKKILSSNVNDHSSYLRDGITGKIISRRIKTEMPYRGVFSTNENMVVICGWGAAVPVSAETGELVGNTMINDDAVADAAFSPDGKLLATANYDGSVRFWVVAGGFIPRALNHQIEHVSRPERLAFIDNNTLVVHCVGGQNYVWTFGDDSSKLKVIPRMDRPDLLNIREDDADLTAIGKEVTGNIKGTSISVRMENPISVIALNPKGDAFAIGAKDEKFEVTSARLYHLSNLAEPIELNHRDGINYIGFSPSGEMMVTCSEDFSAILWNARTGKRITQPMRHRWQVSWAAFSSDERWLVTAGWDEACTIWNTKNGDPITPPLRTVRSVSYVAFEPGDNGIVISSPENDFRMDLPFENLPLSESDRRKYLNNWVEPTVTRF